jgi:hypothetical protein
MLTSGKEKGMSIPTRINSSTDLPEAVKRSLGIGRFRAKIFQRRDGEIIAKAIQDIGEVIIKLTHFHISCKLSAHLSTSQRPHSLLRRSP